MSPYTALVTDRTIEVDETLGHVQINMEAGPATGSVHTVKWFAWTMTSAPPTVSGNVNQIEDPNSTAATMIQLGPTAVLPTEGEAVTWTFDGTQWVVTA